MSYTNPRQVSKIAEGFVTLGIPPMDFEKISTSEDFVIYVRNASKSLGIPPEELAKPDSEFTRDYLNTFFRQSGRRIQLNQLTKEMVTPFLRKYSPDKIIL